jgi:hypothetical protein
MGVLQNNYAQIVPGALISASYVSDLYDVLTGNETEDVIISGSFVISGSAMSTVGFIGSLQGTASFSISSSYTVSSSYAISASYAPYTDSASVSLLATSASYANIATTALTASYVLFIDSSSAADTSISSSYAISASYAPPTTWSDIYTSATGHVIYVSPSGSDSNDGLSSAKPLQTLYAAKTLAVSGSVIIVGAGIYEFDNRDSNGNYWNTRVNEVNLWKNGVIYYFCIGAKIILRNQSVTGVNLALFNPDATINETCFVDGYLEYEQYGYGADTTDGRNNYFKYIDANGGGCNFYTNTKKLTSWHCQLYEVEPITLPVVNIFESSEEHYWQFINSGNVGVGAAYIFNGRISNTSINYRSNVTRRIFPANSVCSFYIRGSLETSKFRLIGDYIYSPVTLFRGRTLTCSDIIIDIKEIDYSWAYTPFNLLGIVSSELGGAFTLNLIGNLNDISNNSLTTGIFHLSSGANHRINFKGNINTKTTSGTGRFIVSNTTAGSVVNIDGDINFLGSSNTTNIVFQSQGTGTIVNFKGNVTGNFSFLAHPRSGGVVNINNSRIESIANGARVYTNTTTTLSTMRISNSDIRMLNTGSALTDGRYLNVRINNSNIVNTGTTDALYNSTTLGSLQILNSSVYTNSGSAINYTSSIIASNTVINTAYSGSLTGSLTQLSGMVI